MKYRGVEGGTPTGQPLCRTCRNAHLSQGLSASSCRLYCIALPSKPIELKFEAYECTSYDDKRLPLMYQMEELAWIFKTDVKTREIGFVSPSDRNRQVGPPAAPSNEEPK